MNLAPFAAVLYNEAVTNQREIDDRNYYLGQPLKVVGEETFNHMLECLPPMLWVGIPYGERFCMMEMQTGSITSSYAKYKGKYYHKYVDITRPDTFITAELIEAFLA